MTLRPALALHLLCLAVLRLASLIVPRTQRSEWWREWSAELWHVREACTPSRGISWAAEREVAAFCLGAFQDARCLRAQSTPLPLPRATTMGSASQCLLLLAGLIIASLSIATLLPGVREQLYQFRYRVPPGIVLVQSARTTDDTAPTISGEQFLLWKQRRQQLFTAFAFYQVERESDITSLHTQPKINIARASSNLFQLLRLPSRPHQAQPTSQPSFSATHSGRNNSPPIQTSSAKPCVSANTTQSSPASHQQARGDSRVRSTPGCSNLTPLSSPPTTDS